MVVYFVGLKHLRLEFACAHVPDKICKSIEGSRHNTYIYLQHGWEARHFASQNGREGLDTSNRDSSPMKGPTKRGEGCHLSWVHGHRKHKKDQDELEKKEVKGLWKWRETLWSPPAPGMGCARLWAKHEDVWDVLDYEPSMRMWGNSPGNVFFFVF
jgi:hypothetical protein